MLDVVSTRVEGDAGGLTAAGRLRRHDEQHDRDGQTVGRAGDRQRGRHAQTDRPSHVRRPQGGS